MYHTNDLEHYPEVDREERLTALAKEGGFELEFIN
jgi:hypothetical protein